MVQSLFQDLGLSPNEAKIYEALITYGASGVSTVSLRAKVHRRNAYDALQRLLEKGLVSEQYGRNETVYQPVAPGKLLELVQEKEDRLHAVLPQLEKAFRETRLPEQAYIFKGTEGVKNYLKEALDVGEDMYLLGAEGAWLDPRVATYTRWFLQEAKKKRMRINALFDHDFLDLHVPPKAFASKWKILPDKYYTNTTMDIFGDFVVTYTGTAPGRLEDDITIFVLQSPDLAKSYRMWWQLIWDLLPEPKKEKKMR